MQIFGIITSADSPCSFTSHKVIIICYNFISWSDSAPLSVTFWFVFQFCTRFNWEADTYFYWYVSQCAEELWGSKYLNRNSKFVKWTPFTFWYAGKNWVESNMCLWKCTLTPYIHTPLTQWTVNTEWVHYSYWIICLSLPHKMSSGLRWPVKLNNSRGKAVGSNELPSSR